MPISRSKMPLRFWEAAFCEVDSPLSFADFLQNMYLKLQNMYFAFLNILFYDIVRAKFKFNFKRRVRR